MIIGEHIFCFYKKAQGKNRYLKEMKRDKIKKICNSLIAFLIAMSVGSCSKSQSYSELLRDEEHAVNWYLANYNVALELPENMKDLVTYEMAGEDAPFYKLDNDGYVYMQVVRAELNDMVSSGDLVYFRFNRESIIDLYRGIESSSSGNSDYLPNGASSFVYKNNVLSSTTIWGTGIQMPLAYLGYNSEVNLVLRSYYGFAEEQSQCIPFLINLRYFKPEY